MLADALQDIDKVVVGIDVMHATCVSIDIMGQIACALGDLAPVFRIP